MSIVSIWSPVPFMIMRFVRELTMSRFASVGSSLALDGFAGVGEEIPESQRLLGAESPASPVESVVDSTGPGRVTCKSTTACYIN